MKTAARKPTQTPRRSVTKRIRTNFGVTREVFTRLTGFSQRALANWESGRLSPKAEARRRLTELERLHGALTQVIRPEAIPEWLDTPNEAFAGLKPLEVIERGEVDRLWKMIYALESGAIS